MSLSGHFFFSPSGNFFYLTIRPLFQYRSQPKMIIMSSGSHGGCRTTSKEAAHEVQRLLQRQKLNRGLGVPPKPAKLTWHIKERHTASKLTWNVKQRSKENWHGASKLTRSVNHRIVELKRYKDKTDVLWYMLYAWSVKRVLIVTCDITNGVI